MNQKNEAKLDLPDTPPILGPEKKISKHGVIIALRDMKVGKRREGDEWEIITELLQAGGDVVLDQLIKLFK